MTDERIEEGLTAMNQRKQLAALWERTYCRHVYTHLFSPTWQDVRRNFVNDLTISARDCGWRKTQDISLAILAAQLSAFTKALVRAPAFLVPSALVLHQDFLRTLPQEEGEQIQQWTLANSQSTFRVDDPMTRLSQEAFRHAGFEDVTTEMVQRLAAELWSLYLIWAMEVVGKDDEGFLIDGRSAVTDSGSDEPLAARKVLTALFLAGFVEIGDAPDRSLGCIVCGHRKPIVANLIHLYVDWHTHATGVLDHCRSHSGPRWLDIFFPGLWGWRGRMLRNRNSLFLKDDRLTIIG